MNFLPGWQAGLGLLKPAGAGALTSLAEQDSATSTDSATITGPASIQSGDLLVMSDFGTNGALNNAPPEAAPSGFTITQSVLIGSLRRHVLSFKIADGSEASASLTGMDDGGFVGGKALYVFRGNIPITSANAASGGAEGTTGDPSSQNVAASGGTPPLVVVAAYGAAGAIDPRTFSPAKDGEISAVGTFNTQTFLAYRIYNSSPADTTVDMDDEGSANSLLSRYIECS